MSGTNLDEFSGKVMVESAKPQLKEPKKYKVILLNDDYTPMEFVVTILQSFFGLDEATAITIMLQVHHQGKGVCGVFTRDVAESKVAQICAYAQRCEQPLLCVMEPE